jgi:hypothetical protein
MKSLCEALSKNNITLRPISIVNVASSFNLGKPFAMSTLIKILLKKVKYVSGSTRKLYQLTGEWDRELNQPTINRTESQFGLTGTDLGSSFDHNGRVYFLFGDTNSTNPNQPHDGDSIAFTEDDDPEQGVHLNFVTSANDPHNYLSPSIRPPPIISLGTFEVPITGFSANDKMYVFFTTEHFTDADGHEVTGRSVLAWSGDSAQSPFNYLYDLSGYQGISGDAVRDLSVIGKFINVSTVIVNNAYISGLPDIDGKGLLLWGSGLYRRSNPYLAYIPLAGVEHKNNLRYFAGTETGSDRPIWSRQESEAVKLFDQPDPDTDLPQIGEICVSWNQFLVMWLMLYNANSPRGINFRVAKKPWGPWSPMAVLFDPVRDQGYCHFMHGFRPDPITRTGMCLVTLSTILDERMTGEGSMVRTLSQVIQRAITTTLRYIS